MTPKRKKYAKALARSRNSSKSIAIDALKDGEGRKWITAGIGKVVKYELQLLCSDRASSVQQSQNRDDVTNFPWKGVIEECAKYCPTLWSILISCTTTKTERSNQLYFVAAIVCMLSKFRSSRMSLFQKLVSTILYADHVGTAVCQGEGGAGQPDPTQRRLAINFYQATVTDLFQLYHTWGLGLLSLHVHVSYKYSHCS